MINFSKLLEVAIPVIGTVSTTLLTETNQSVSPIKQENLYNTIVSSSLSTLAKEIVKDDDNESIVLQDKYPDINNITAYDIAKRKKYKHNF